MANSDGPIEQFMTAAPVTIAAQATLAEARRTMLDQGLRHLPVQQNGRLLGIVTERDLYVLALFPEIDFTIATVAFAMSTDLYRVSPLTALGEVAAGMAQRRIGSALVTDPVKGLVGIFTDFDALKVLAYA